MRTHFALYYLKKNLNIYCFFVFIFKWGTPAELRQRLEETDKGDEGGVWIAVADVAWQLG
jgi:hypothetical protein